MSENRDVARLLMSIADLLDLAGERFKPEAYRRAARSIEALPESLRSVEAREGLEQIPGVGEAIAEKVREFLKTGRLGYYERLQHEFPAGLIELMQLPGIGPKTARRFWTELGVEGPSELAQAIETGRLDGVKGFGPKKIEQFRAALAQKGAPRARLSLVAAAAIAREVVSALRAEGHARQVEIAGSLRRCRETIGDLDILATSPEPEKVLTGFTKLPAVRSVVLAGGTKATVLYRDDVQIDLRVVEPKSFGAAWQYFTGSKDHNIHLRTIARDHGLKINEYGVFRGEEWLAGETEQAVYDRLGLAWMPPEIRENQGEIEAGLQRKVPPLVTAKDVRGLLHVHLPPDASPESVDRLVTEAARRRWEYVGVVVSSAPAPGKPAVLPSRVLDRLRHHRSSSGSVRVLLADEGSQPSAGATYGPDGELDYWILAFEPAESTGERPSTGVAEPWLVAHPGPTPDTGSTVTDLGRRAPRNTAVDVTPEPGVEGFDSAVVRAWRDAGGQVVVSPGGLDPFEEHRFDLALGLARRGWTGPRDLLNGRPGAELPFAPARRKGRSRGAR